MNNTNTINIQNHRHSFSELMRIYGLNYTLFMRLFGVLNTESKPKLNGREKWIGNKRYRIQLREFERGGWTSTCLLDCHLMNARNGKTISLLFSIPIRIYLDSKQIQVLSSPALNSESKLLKLLKIDTIRHKASIKWHLNRLLNNILMTFCGKMHLSI